MPIRNAIATYVAAKSLEATDGVEPRGEDAREPTPGELAEIARALQVMEDIQAKAGNRAGIMTTAADETVANLQTFITTVMAPTEDKFEASANGTLEATFDAHDFLGWAGSFFSWWRKLTPFPWVNPGLPQTLPAKFRVALLGDWGTGLYGAPHCASSIERDGRYDLVLHLGDVYYSGTKGEIHERFIDLFPKVPNAINRGLNGNHEMYTGGVAYFDAIQRWGQTASYFAFENAHWILGCLDTAYDDHDLHGTQAQWISDLAAASPDKKLVLFSHHQPFSILSRQGPKLVSKLQALFESRRIYAWYWGHEHQCILYRPHKLYGLRGRCVGHGGFPEFRPTKVLGDRAPAKPEWKTLESRNLVPSGKILDGANEFISEAPEDYGPHGYMSLEFDGPNLREIVHLPDGGVVWKQPVDFLDR